MSRYSKLMQRPWFLVLMIFLAWKIMMLCLVFYATEKVHQVGYNNNTPVVTTNPLLQGTVKYDGHHYLEIIEKGYGDEPNRLPAFYPLFPLMVKGGTYLGIGAIASAYLINSVATYFAMLFLFLLSREFFKNPNQAIRPLLLFSFFPTAYFLNMFYTEALFCALSFGAFYFARKRNWMAAGLLLAPLSATRLPGVIVAIAVLVEYLSSIGWKPHNLSRQGLWLLLAPIGIISYMFYLHNQFGDPFMFKNAYKHGWGYQIFEPNILKTLFEQIKILFDIAATRTGEWREGFLDSTMFLGSWLAGLAIIIKGRNLVPISFTIYGLLSLILFSLNSNFISANRYLLPLFPIYLIAAFWLSRREAAFSVLLAISATAMGLLMTLFANGYWTG